jgi:uncharacterized protein (TIGR00730 family)
MRRVCVFCGSAVGARPAYADAARALGEELVRRRLGLVYGGGSVGLMGILADTVLAAGGEAVGVIPHGLASRELAHAHLTEQHVVDNMHLRKAEMAERSDAFVALPGGLGTLEELLEILTWSQLGIHRKPVGILNVANYWDALTTMLSHAVHEGFVTPENAALLLVADTSRELLDRMTTWTPPSIARPWLTPDET